MQAWLLQSETALRIGVFLAVLAALLVLEAAWPRRGRRRPRWRRWTGHLALAMSANLLIRGVSFFAPALLAVGAAIWAGASGFGLLNLAALPGPISFIIAVVALDFAIWLQHVLSHRVGLLWQFHALHHRDEDLDASTALRFHPLEIAVSAIYKSAWVVLLGPSAAAVIAFEILLNACALFTHANLAVPRWLDRPLRAVLVTPDMHRIHHSTCPREHHRNFGFCLSFWDRLFATYLAQPAAGHTEMELGLPAAPVDAQQPTSAKAPRASRRRPPGEGGMQGLRGPGGVARGALAGREA
ncbi:MAG: sterol desaturase family protein [Pseudomonadota bacterium]